MATRTTRYEVMLDVESPEPLTDEQLRDISKVAVYIHDGGTVSGVSRWPVIVTIVDGPTVDILPTESPRRPHWRSTNGD